MENEEEDFQRMCGTICSYNNEIRYASQNGLLETL